MCGILGIIAAKGRFRRTQVQAALDSLEHRGPDAHGLETISLPHDRELWLGHRRLAIIDLSDSANQPFSIASKSGRGTLVYNGEIYNHQELARDAEFRLQTSSDTEVLANGLTEKGPRFLREANGFFAFGFFNHAAQSLLLARDRLGKKPLYVYRANDILAFASELKAFAKLGLELSLSTESRAFYRWMGYIPGTQTIYRECSKFPAASFSELDLCSHQLPTIHPELFWDPLAACSQRAKASLGEATEEFLSLLDDACKLRLRADVPVGIFLSGGIDSSLVASSVARQSGVAARAYTVKPSDPNLDESDVALETGKRLGLEVHVLTLEETDYARQVERIPWHYDEPFADSSAIPTMAIAEAAAKHLKVVLTGDGGDEVFLGYPWFRYPDRLMPLRNAAARVPFGRRFARRALQHKRAPQLVRLMARTFGFNPETIDYKMGILDTLFAETGDDETAERVYDFFRCNSPRRTLPATDQKHVLHHSLRGWAEHWYPQYNWAAATRRSRAESLAALDLSVFMRDDVLVKVDRATMAYGLEARSPLLDYRIVEFGLSLPCDYKCTDDTFKRILRNALGQRLPGRLTQLKKMGFGVPLPSGLPRAPTPTAAWNKKIEQDWCSTWNTKYAAAKD